MNNAEFRFQEASKKERWALKHILPSQTKYTEINSFDKYDAITLIKDTKFIVEAKIRDTHYPTLLLETIKCNDLINESKKLAADIMYVVFTPDGTFIFNITKLLQSNPELFEINNLNCPKSTMGDTTYKTKTTYLLPIKFAKKHNFKFDVWKYLEEQYDYK